MENIARKYSQGMKDQSTILALTELIVDLSECFGGDISGSMKNLTNQFGTIFISSISNKRVLSIKPWFLSTKSKARWPENVVGLGPPLL